MSNRYLTPRYFRWLFKSGGKVGELRIFSLSWWTNDLPEAWLADTCIFVLPVLILYDLIFWVIDSGVAAAKAVEAKWAVDHKNDLRLEQAEQVRKAYLADLRIAELIDDPDTREMAVAHANSKFHRRLAEIMERE